jgi:predicted DNA-binding protein
MGDKMAKKLISVYMDEKQIERLAKLSAKTRVPRSVYIRDGLDFILDKCEKQLKGRNRK